MARTREAGQGMLWQRGRVWWIKYYVAGRAVRESTGTDDPKQAQRFLNERLGRVATGQPVLPKADRVRVEQLLDDLRAHYETTGRRNLREADTRFVPLRSFFTGRRAASVAGPLLTEYVHRRQSAVVANGNRSRGASGLMWGRPEGATYQ